MSEGEYGPLFPQEILPPKRKRIAHLSVSGMETHHTCPWQFYARYIIGLPSKTDFPRLTGVVIHKMLDKLYDPHRHDGRFYFKDVDKTAGYYYGEFKREYDQVQDEGKFLDDEKKYRSFTKLGEQILRKYWVDNMHLPDPIEREKRYTYMTPRGVRLLGIMDQVRAVSLDYVQRHRPNLIVDGKLHPDFDPVVVADFKSGYLNYDITRFESSAKMELLTRTQHLLHHGYQGTMYTGLYQVNHISEEHPMGKQPIGFEIYDLRKGQKYFSYRKGSDYTYLTQAVYQVIDHIESGKDYVKNYGFACSRCDFVEPCHGEEDFILVLPEGIADGFELEDLTPEYRNLVTSIRFPSPIVSPTISQKRMKMPVKISRGEEPLFKFTGRTNNIRVVPGSPEVIDVNEDV